MGRAVSRSRSFVGLREIGLWAMLLLLFPRFASAQNLGFVVDNSQGAVRILDLSQRSVMNTVLVGQHPAEMLILPNNQIAYVTCPDNNNVAIVDLQNQTLVDTIPTGQAPGSLIGSSDGRYVYVANEGSNDVTVLDAVDHLSLATIPVGASPLMVNLSPDGRFLYVVNHDADPTGTVSVIDTNRRQLVETLEVGLQPTQFAVAPDLKTAYVVNSGSNSVSIVDLTTNQVTEQIDVGSGPTGVTFSTGGQSLYVVNRDSNNITVINTGSKTVVGQIPVGSQPTDLVLTFDSHFGFVSNQGSNNVTLLDLFTRTAELNIPTGVTPFDLALDSNEDFLYVTNLGSQSVTVIDVNTDKVVATVPLGGIPVQFTQYNAPTLLELAPNPATTGSTLILNGEGLLPSSTVQFVSTTPPRNVKVAPVWLDSQGLQVTIPSLPGASTAIVSVLHADGNSSEQLTLRFGSSISTISAGGVFEGAGFQPAPHPISGNSLVSVIGSFPGVAPAYASAIPLQTLLGNSRVTFNGTPAFLLFSSSGQINLITPLALFARSSVRVAVTAGTQTSPVETVEVAPAAPGIFKIGATSFGVFVHGDRPRNLVSPSDPAQRGELLILYATALGNTFPEALEGEPSQGDILSETLVPVTATIGGIAADVSFSGFAPGLHGLYQIKLEVPLDAPIGDDISVIVSVESTESNRVLLAVR
jgi:uncharacterized protein (TIGR03437 family)